MSHEGHAHALEEGADRAGIVASAICAVHCAASLLLMGSAGAVANVLHNEWLERAFYVTAVSIAAVAIGQGYRRHRDKSPLGLFALGLLGITAARLAPESLEEVFSILGAISLVAAHVVNLRAARACACPHPAA